jgi:hypothetical protein
MPVFEFDLDPPAPRPATARRPPGRPPGRKPGVPNKPKKLRQPSPAPSTNILLVSNDIESERNLEDIQVSKMTSQELTFIQNYLVLGMSKQDAMKSAGYQSDSEPYLNKLGGKLVRKYESQTGDHRKIFRAVGAGEVAVARGLLAIAQGPYPADVRRKAWAIASCLGLKSEVVESFQGMQIVIRGMDDSGQVDGDGPPRALPPPPKPQQITK